MTRPASSPEGVRLASTLRELRERTGLSLAGLAARTTFSKSSWERYLNGRTLPPRTAVEELCRLANEPVGRCLSLWEIAESEWGGRAKEAEPARPARPTAAPPAPALPAATAATADGSAPVGAAPVGAAPVGAAPVGHRGAATAAVLASASAAVFGAIALTLFLLPGRHGTPLPAAHPSASASASASSSVTGPRCRGTACEGGSPMDMRCATAPETLAEHVTATGASVQLRYSRECGTSWTRMWGARIGDRIESEAVGGVRTYRAEVKDRAEADTYVHTAMTATRPGTLVRTCFLPTADGGTECFEARVGRSPEPTPRTRTSHPSTT
ncbi:helix-turn-helix domain-containing protein [Streptomyces sp. NPDC057690]|uniref:helix-turn-helix domain-containing protein n=1 Tax=Streptomyces sp. NPDC057690 TaxID=3346214 RepID=UPI0036742228